MKLSEFPHDMQVLIWQLWEDAGEEPENQNPEIPAGMLPTKCFPARIEGNAPGDDREFESYLETPIEEYPPLLIAHGVWIDGRHRLWAARTRDVKEIQTADISSILPRSYVKKARFLGKMRCPANLETLSEPLKLARRAAIYLYQTDRDFVVGGCSDVSEVIAAWLKKKGYNAEAVYGAARYGKKAWFLHAWIEVDGKRFDPVLWVQGRNMAKHEYTIEPEAAKALRCDVEYILESSVEELDREIGD